MADERSQRVECVIVSHTHWDREWYRSFQEFRAHLVDAVDALLELLHEDPGYRFALDGQSVVAEDYLEVRPDRRDELAAACREGRITLGPWYVQPDSILPSGEAHIRNLLEGRRVAMEIGSTCSRVAYTPDSFGHPAQFPQLFAGFGIDGFLHWRGSANEHDVLGPVFQWMAPDGSEVLNLTLVEGYHDGGNLLGPPEVAAARFAAVGNAVRLGDTILILNGADHLPPDPTIAEVADRLADDQGWLVTRGLLEDYLDIVPRGSTSFTGEMLGARLANLLQGVWSTRTWIKLRNRRIETLLTSWLEPWAVLGCQLGLADERPSIRSSWRALLKNQAHDSICGCSIDGVATDMVGRFEEAEGLGRQTTQRLLERIAGAPTDRRIDWSDSIDVAVFNPSPHARTDVVRYPIEAFPLYGLRADGTDLHPQALSSALSQGFTADGSPVRIVVSDDPDRIRMVPDQPVFDLEFVARDVPALGWRRVRIEPAQPADDLVDDGRQIALDGISVEVASDGTLDVQIGEQRWRGLFGVEDVGDRGDTYDFDAVGEPTALSPTSLKVVRHRFASGIQTLVVRRRYSVPAGLSEDRAPRSSATSSLELDLEVRLAPNVPRVDVRVALTNEATDHRVRLLFPTNDAEGVIAATTFDVVSRAPQTVDDAQWIHPAPVTFPHQGFVSAGGLTVVAPGLTEAEVIEEGTLAVTLLRSVGWLARLDLASRTQVAGPSLRAPDAQCLGELCTSISLLAGNATDAIDAELGLWAVPAGDAPRVDAGISLLELEPRSAILSAFKPSEDGHGAVLRVLNVTDEPMEVRARSPLGFASARAVRLDEEPSPGEMALDGESISFTVRPHGLASVQVSFSGPLDAPH